MSNYILYFINYIIHYKEKRHFNEKCIKRTINTVIDKFCLDRISNKVETGKRIVHSAKQNTRDVNKRLFLSPIGNMLDRVADNTYKS